MKVHVQFAYMYLVDTVVFKCSSSMPKCVCVSVSVCVCVVVLRGLWRWGTAAHGDMSRGGAVRPGLEACSHPVLQQPALCTVADRIMGSGNQHRTHAQTHAHAQAVRQAPIHTHPCIHTHKQLHSTNIFSYSRCILLMEVGLCLPKKSIVRQWLSLCSD